jgi:hypothetical protein
VPPSGECALTRFRLQLIHCGWRGYLAGSRQSGPIVTNRRPQHQQLNLSHGCMHPFESRPCIGSFAFISVSLFMHIYCGRDMPTGGGDRGIRLWRVARRNVEPVALGPPTRPGASSPRVVPREPGSTIWTHRERRKSGLDSVCRRWSIGG